MNRVEVGKRNEDEFINQLELVAAHPLIKVEELGELVSGPRFGRVGDAAEVTRVHPYAVLVDHATAPLRRRGEES